MTSTPPRERDSYYRSPLPGPSRLGAVLLWVELLAASRVDWPESARSGWRPVDTGGDR